MADSVSVLNYLDAYCERAGDPSLFGEPLNAVTNLFFILAALLAGRAILRLQRNPARSPIDLWLLVIALFCIGIGSGLWHLHPNATTVLMDVIPITVFINVYIVAVMSRLFAQSWGKIALWWLAYFAASMAAQATLPPGLLNGTIMYIPTYVTLGLITLAMFRRHRALAPVFVKVMLVWSVSLVCRTVDIEMCSHLAIGTHFLWHTLNAWVLWRLLLVLVAHARMREAQALQA